MAARGLSCCLAALWLAPSGALGCEELVYRDVDPPIRLAGSGGDAEPSGPPELVVGFTEDGLFTSLADDDSLVIVHGLQGGTWSMPTLRTRGIGAFAVVVCALTTASGETVGHVDARIKFFPSLDGPLEVQALPIPVNHAAPNEDAPIDDLYGQGADLDCRVGDDKGHEARVSYPVTLVAG